MVTHTSLLTPKSRQKRATVFDHLPLGDVDALAESARMLAPFTWLPRLVLQFLHVILVLVLVSIAVWFAWTHIVRPSLTGRETVLTVIDPIVVVRSSESGVFRREGGLAHGSRVQRGQLLGRILSPKLEKEHQVLEAEKAAVSRALLDSTDSEAERRDLELRLAALDARLTSARARLADLKIRSPVEGTIQFGVGDYQEVDGERTAIAQVWPSDGVTLIEIAAPVHIVTDLVQRGRVQCELATAAGPVTVNATPLIDTLQTYFEDELEGRRKSQWASIRCRPRALPALANRPGLVGSIQY